MELKTIRGGVFYGPVLVMTLLCGGLSTLLTWFALETVEYSVLMFVCFFLFMMVYMWVKYYKNTPIVRMSDEGIRYRGKRYGWMQIQYASFKTQRPFATVGKNGAYMDVVTLAFDDGNELLLFDKMYRNGYEIRKYLEARVQAELVKEKQEDTVIIPEEQTEEALKTTKRKMRWFAFGFVIWNLSLSFLIVYFNVPKGGMLLAVVLNTILFVLAFRKVFDRKRRSNNNGNGQ